MADNVTNIEGIKAVKADAVIDKELKVRFTKTYNFEGEKVSEVDFSGLENATAKTLIKAGKVLTTAGDIQVLPEMSLHYALIVAGECTKYPFEFYETLAPRDAVRVKNIVTNFMYGEA